MSHSGSRHSSGSQRSSQRDRSSAAPGNLNVPSANSRSGSPRTLGGPPPIDWTLGTNVTSHSRPNNNPDDLNIQVESPSSDGRGTPHNLGPSQANTQTGYPSTSNCWKPQNDRLNYGVGPYSQGYPNASIPSNWGGFPGSSSYGNPGILPAPVVQSPRPFALDNTERNSGSLTSLSTRQHLYKCCSHICNYKIRQFTDDYCDECTHKACELCLYKGSSVGSLANIAT